MTNGGQAPSEFFLVELKMGQSSSSYRYFAIISASFTVIMALFTASRAPFLRILCGEKEA